MDNFIKVAINPDQAPVPDTIMEGIKRGDIIESPVLIPINPKDLESVEHDPKIQTAYLNKIQDAIKSGVFNDTIIVFDGGDDFKTKTFCRTLADLVSWGNIPAPTIYMNGKKYC